MNKKDLENLKSLFMSGYVVKDLVNVFPDNDIVVLLYKESPVYGNINGENKMQPMHLLFPMSLKESELASGEAMGIAGIVQQILQVQISNKMQTKQGRQILLNIGAQSFREALSNWIDKKNENMAKYIEALEASVQAGVQGLEEMSRN